MAAPRDDDAEMDDATTDAAPDAAAPVAAAPVVFPVMGPRPMAYPGGLPGVPGFVMGNTALGPLAARAGNPAFAGIPNGAGVLPLTPFVARPGFTINDLMRLCNRKDPEDFQREMREVEAVRFGPRTEAELMAKIEESRDDPAVRYLVHCEGKVQFIEARSDAEAFIAFCQYLERTRGPQYSADSFLTKPNTYVNTHFLKFNNVRGSENPMFTIMQVDDFDGEEAPLTAQGVPRPGREIKPCRADAGADKEEDEEEE